jgi:hypothetical protein
MVLNHLCLLCLFVAKLRRRCKALERVAVKRVGLPCSLIPHAVLIADDCDGENYAIRTKLVAGRDPVVEFSARLHGKLNRSRRNFLCRR